MRIKELQAKQNILQLRMSMGKVHSLSFLEKDHTLLCALI